MGWFGWEPDQTRTPVQVFVEFVVWFWNSTTSPRCVVYIYIIYNKYYLYLCKAYILIKLKYISKTLFLTLCQCIGFSIGTLESKFRGVRTGESCHQYCAVGFENTTEEANFVCGFAKTTKKAKGGSGRTPMSFHVFCFSSILKKMYISGKLHEEAWNFSFSSPFKCAMIHDEIITRS